MLAAELFCFLTSPTTNSGVCFMRPRLQGTYSWANGPDGHYFKTLLKNRPYYEAKKN